MQNSVSLSLFLFVYAEVLGCGLGPTEADPNEPVHHVHVWEHHLHLPHHDGLHDGLEAHPGAYVYLCQ